MTQRETLLGAKIPGRETGIEIRRTLCDICSPSFHCGVDAYVKDGVIIKIEGTKEHPLNQGMLCTKGLSGRQYAYRKDRIQTPLRRVGKRGEGAFEPIGWEEAIAEIAGRLDGVRTRDGADAVAFFTGYSKWYRPFLQRFAHSFGTRNYGSESSTCFTSGVMAWKVATGKPARPDLEHAGVFLGWAYNPYHSRYLNGRKADAFKAGGGKIIIVDPRITLASERLADIHLRPRGGTDGALALGMAKVLIDRGWIDEAYIRDYVHGFDSFREYVARFDEAYVEQETGVPPDQLIAACRMIHENGPLCVNESSAPLGHHRNGMQNYRAIMALTALTGSYDRRGGQMPADFTFTHQYAGYSTREEAYIHATCPQDSKPPVGAQRFPLWDSLEGEMQAVDLPRQILEGTPYPVKAVLALGMNLRMFPDTAMVKRALEELEFFVDVDLFLTDTAKYADIVLPACTSYERGEFKSYPGGWAFYTRPAIDKLYDSKSDVEILTLLADALDLPDPLLRQGYESGVRWMLQDLSVTVEQLKASEFPVKVPEFRPHAPERYCKDGMNTPSGKFELRSSLIEAHPEWGLDPLPTYVAPLDEADPLRYPFTLCAGARIPGALHSRLHDVQWVRSLQPQPTADINDGDAGRLGIAKGDDIRLSTPGGSITVKANPTFRVQEGMVHMYHGYREADVNALMNKNHVDPYSGFPAYRSTRCSVEKR